MLTRRGITVVALLVGVLLVAVQFGGRSLNAIVVPGLLALFAGYLQLRLVDRPSIERRLPADGFPGTTRSVEVAFATDDPVHATVEDTVGPGLSATENRGQTTIADGETFAYGVTYERRGERTVGPFEATVTDLFGFTYRTFRFASMDSITVYPQVRTLSGGFRTALYRIAQSTAQRQREEFDRLREYDRGDSLRDVHWKSSAKRPQNDLVVKEFTSEETLGDIRVAAGCHDDVDGLASVTASAVIFLLDSGFSVGLATAEGTIDPATGTDHRAALLETLATLESGRPDQDAVDAADLHVSVPDDHDRPVLDLGDRTLAVDGLDDEGDPLRILGGGVDHDASSADRTEVPAA